ncbi:MAG TPA: 50S ribosomal protein L18 [Candidatus Saccharimonadales bacterium]|nr:50S ribosomal protein L18 [Candidatus Saccharimonadales bacterium]
MSNQLAHKLHNKQQRKQRIRSVVSGTAKRPRLNVHVSNIHVSAQLIDDTAGKTLVAITTVGQKNVKGSMTEKAAWVGTEIAGKAKTAKIKSVVFDRGGKLYHGRVAALADAARKAGLEF